MEKREIPNQFLQEVNRQVTKKKVLFVIDSLQFGGAEQSLLVNSSGFRKIKPVVCHLYEGDTLKQRFEENGVKVYSLNIRRKYGFVRAYRLLSKVVEVEKPDLVVAYLTRSEIVARVVAKKHQIPVIGSFVSDLYGKDYNQHLSWKAKKLVSFFKWINKLTSRFCIGFIANSETIKDVNARHLSISPDKVQVINRGRESRQFITKAFNGNMEKGSIHFINVGRLFPVKGQKELILAFRNFLEINSNATLTIIGEGPSRNELENIVKTAKLREKVHLLGARNDIPSILSEFNCFVFPSFSEGFSGAIVEAMFAGLPVLASDIPQNKEAIRHLETGYLFQSGSVNAITKAMVWFSENRLAAAGFSKEAYDFAKQNFELANTIMQLENYLCNQIELKN